MGQYIDEENGHFRIEYGPPLGGIDTSAPPSLIAPNRLQNAQNFFIENNKYITTNWNQLLPNLVGLDTTNNFIGAFDIFYQGTNFLVQVFAKNNNVAIIWGSNITAPGHNPSIAVTGNLIQASFKNIAGQMFISGQGLAEIEKLDFTQATPSLTNLTTVNGGKFLGELNGRLLALNLYVNNSGTIVNYPARVAWSAGQQQYGIWNVLDINNLPTGAGFNDLPDIEDEITGFISIGPTGYIFRKQGITEVTPLNSGIQPFDFNHLWASHKGIGTVFPQTLSQYGNVAAFVSETDIFMMGAGGSLESLTANTKAIVRQALTANAVTPNSVFGVLTPLTMDGTPGLYYILCVPTIDGNSILTYIIDVETRELMVFKSLMLQGLDGSGNPVPGTIQALPSVSSEVLNLGVLSSTPLLGVQTAGASTVFYYVIPDFTSTTQQANYPCTLQFKAEELNPLQQYTIDGIVVYANGLQGEQLQIFISDNNGFQTTFLPITMGNGWQYYKTTVPPGTPQTQLAFMSDTPTLNVQYTGNRYIQIGKIILYGSTVPMRPF